MNKEEYFYFNSAFNNVFFDGRFQSLPIYLDLEDPIRTELSAALSIPEDDFDKELGSCLFKTFQWDTGNIYQWHIENLNNWNTSNPQEAPPFTALLIAFSLAAEHMRKGDDDDYSASNYYQRLAEILGLKDESRKVKISRDGKYTEQFWHALNNWLKKNDFLYGRPTAKQINSWKYVSYSISQSLVRDGDRKTLHKLFNYSGFSGQEKINESEMKSYIHSWMATSGPSSWLKKLWGVPDLRDRVISAAIYELESWGDLNTGLRENITSGSEGFSKINLAAVIQNFPNSKINLFLVTSIPDYFEQSIHNITDELLSKKILNNNINELVLIKWPGIDIGYFDLTKININSILLHSFDLQNANSEKILRRETRAIIPLIKDDATSLYREVNRGVLFAEHIVICHRKMEAKVKNYLNKYARVGFEFKDSAAIKGLPDEWLLIQNVEITIASQDNEEEDLQALVPLSEGEDIYLSNGLRLTSGIWHSKAPPDVFASDGVNPLEITIKSNELNLENNDLEDKNNSANFLSYFQDLSGKNLILLAKKNGKVKVERDISFRDSDVPRKKNILKDPELLYLADPENKIFLYSAEEFKESKKNGPFIQGMICKNMPEISELKADFFLNTQIDRQYEEDTEWIEYDLTKGNESTHNCIDRGYHVWQCPPDPKLRAIDEKLIDKTILQTYQKMRCSDCHFTQIVKRKSKSKDKSISKPKLSENELPQEFKTVRSLNNKISCDIIYDALCYLGSGSRDSIRSLVSKAVEVPWLVSVITQNFIDLGLIDQVISLNGFNYEKWSCSPPSLVLTDNKECYLSGFRNNDLIEQVKTIFKKLNCKFEVINPEDNLSTTVYLWHLGDASTELIEREFKNVKDSYGRILVVQEKPYKYLVNSLPYIKDILPIMPEVHLENNKDLEKFDLLTGKWLLSKITGPGAFRTSHAGKRYVYFDGIKFRECGYELSKLFAARESKIFLHYYDHNTKDFSGLLGCQPPGLFRRALVSCSGKLPITNKNKQRIIYNNIPDDIAKLIMLKLYKE
jgi:hypothetical protein